MSRSSETILVCGGGHQGLSMAAHLALEGEKVALWNRTVANISEVSATGTICCTGAISGEARIERASANLSEVVSNFIMVTTPSTAHRDVARLLAPYAHENMVVVLNPGRTFGAIEFAHELEDCGVRSMPHIAETQTIVHTCRRDSGNSATIFALKDGVGIAALQKDSLDVIMTRMPECLKHRFNPLDSVALTSLSNVGMVLHCAPVLMNIGWIETGDANFKYYYHGISPTIATFLEKMDAERVAVAAALGYKVETTDEWMKRIYGATGKNLYECIRSNTAYEEIDAPRSVHCRYITEDVPNGLVPIEHVGKLLNIETPHVSTIIDLANAIFEHDFREAGRRPTLEMLSFLDKSN